MAPVRSKQQRTPRLCTTQIIKEWIRPLRHIVVDQKLHECKAINLGCIALCEE